jgi:hypothetical protein
MKNNTNSNNFIRRIEHATTTPCDLYCWKNRRLADSLLELSILGADYRQRVGGPFPFPFNGPVQQIDGRPKFDPFGFGLKCIILFFYYFFRFRFLKTFLNLFVFNRVSSFFTLFYQSHDYSINPHDYYIALHLIRSQCDRQMPRAIVVERHLPLRLESIKPQLTTKQRRWAALEHMDRPTALSCFASPPRPVRLLCQSTAPGCFASPPSPVAFPVLRAWLPLKNVGVAFVTSQYLSE